MSRRRVLLASLLAAFAVAAAAAPARAQTAAQRQQQRQQAAGQPQNPAQTNPAQTSDGGEPLKRLDDQSLAGGDYGTEPAPIAGGDYGVQNPATPDNAAAPTIGLIGDPLAAPPGDTPRLRPLAPGFTKDDPYAPLGIRAGSFILRPSLESAGGYDSNPDRVDKGFKGSPFLRLRGGLDVQSDWSRHEVDVLLNGQIRRYTTLDNAGYQPEFNAAVAGRLDVTDRTKLNAELRASALTSRPGDADTPTGIDGDQIQNSVGATLGATQTFNRLSLKLEGLADRYTYNEPELKNGARLDTSDREYNGYELRLRAGYDLSPRLQPFVEAAVDTRDYDLRVDQSGRRLGSSGYSLRTGATFEATRLITGEIAVGYGRQTPKETSLKPNDGLLVDGSIVWAPTALTTVTVNAKTALQETTLLGASGVLDRSIGVAVEHRLRRNLIVTARADFERSSYRGIGRIDDGVTIGLESEYRLSRNLALFGSLQHERLNSSVVGEDYKASIVEVGLRLRR